MMSETKDQTCYFTVPITTPHEHELTALQVCVQALTVPVLAPAAAARVARYLNERFGATP
jgi:hypothetical protein